MRKQRALTVAAAAILLTTSLSACGNDAMTPADPGLETESPSIVAEDTDVAPGTCYGGETLTDNPQALKALVEEYGEESRVALGDNPTFADEVDCAEPHRIEVTGSSALPSDLGPRVEGYRDLLDKDSDLYADLRVGVTAGCNSNDKLLADVSERASIPLSAGPGYGKGYRNGWEPSPADAWESGDRSFICMFVQDTPSPTRAADFYTADFPARSRTCISGAKFVDCSSDHTVERFGVLLLNEAIDAGDLPGEQAAAKDGTLNFSDDQWAALDKSCERFFAAVEQDADPGLTGVTEAPTELWPDETGTNQVFCTAASPIGVKTKDVRHTSTSIFER